MNHRLLAIFALVSVSAFHLLNFQGRASNAADRAVASWLPLRPLPGTCIRVLDSQKVQSDLRRLRASQIFRQTGNYLRVLCGQTLSWVMVSPKAPHFIFPNIELWMADGLTAENRCKIDKAVFTLSKYGRQLKEEGWLVVFVPIPAKLAVEGDELRWPLQGGNLYTSSPILENRSLEVVAATESALISEGFDVVPLSAVFQNYRSQSKGLHLFPAGETHWNGVAIDLAARKAAEVVSNRASIGLALGETSTEETSFLPDFLKDFDAISYRGTRFSEAASAKDTLVNGFKGRGYPWPSNPKSLAVVVGTSYTGQYTWLIGHPVGFTLNMGLYLPDTLMINKAEAGKGSFHAFEVFFRERQTLLQDWEKKFPGCSSRKILIWEFPVRDLHTLANH